MDHPLLAAIDRMRAAKDAYEDACRNAWPVLLAAHPQIRNVLKEWDMDETLAAKWFCTAHFDDGRKTAQELFAEVRGEEVFARINQIAHGVYR
ncbi:hypothetical protein GCM10027430_14410 [Lysobacter tyrosinilyticus]